MKKALILGIVLFIAAFFANHFQIVSIPWLDLPEVATYSGNAKKTDNALKQIDD